MAGILTVTSGPTRTSLVRRGQWILEQILGDPALPPPPGVTPLPPQSQKTDGGGQDLAPDDAEAPRRSDLCVLPPAHGSPWFRTSRTLLMPPVAGAITTGSQPSIDASGSMPGGRAFKGPASSSRKILLASKESFCAHREQWKDADLRAPGRSLQDADDEETIDKLAAATWGTTSTAFRR